MTRGSKGVRIQTERGTITVSPTAVASVAAHAVLETYGVVGMALPSLRDGLVELLQRDNSKRGVVVTTEGDTFAVDLYVVLEYGLRISEIANNIMSNVKFAVERHIGLPAQHVNVHVQALRTSEIDMPQEERARD